MDERIKALKESLDHVHDWPSVYMFKFIVPTISNKFEMLMQLFAEDADTYTKLSRNGKYTSVTIKEVVFSANEILDKYAKVNEIGDVIAL